MTITDNMQLILQVNFSSTQYTFIYICYTFSQIIN